MHDLHLADKILKFVLEQAQENKFKKVSKIKIKLGEIIEHDQKIRPENLKFNLKMLAKDSIIEKAKIEINSIRGNQFIIEEIEGEK